MACKMCDQRGKTWSGDDPKCAFESGVFSTDNWNCATMNRLREISAENGVTTRDDMECASIGYVPFVDAEGDEQNGYIVMTWYKERGRTGNALVMSDDNPHRELTERIALDAIRYHEVEGR